MFFSDPQQVSFLDIMIYKRSDNCIATGLYHKPTATNAILHAQSVHSRHVFQGIPVGQYSRIWRMYKPGSKRVKIKNKLILTGTPLGRAPGGTMPSGKSGPAADTSHNQQSCCYWTA